MEGTLIDHTFSRTIWEEDVPKIYAEKHQITLNKAKKIVFEEYAKVGELEPEWYDLGYWFKKFQLDQDWRKLLKNRKNKVKTYEETRTILEKLEDRLPMIISSNTIREFLEVQLDVLGNYFNDIFSAPSDFNIVKKDETFYRRILEILDLKPEKIVHIGDHYNFDYLAPTKTGIRAYHLDRTGEKVSPETIHNLEDFTRLIDV
jgi:putative hydrolase of the HAD superfamily